LLLPYLVNQVSQINKIAILLFGKLGLHFNQVEVRIFILETQAFEELLQ